MFKKWYEEWILKYNFIYSIHRACQLNFPLLRIYLETLRTGQFLLVRMIWEEYWLLPKNGRSALGWGKLLWALGSLKIFWHICFYLLSCWFIFPSFPLHLESIFYICFNLIILTITFCLFFHSPLFKFINNLFLKCGAFNIQAYKHFWEKDCIGFSLFKIFSKKKTRKIFRGNWLLQISGRSALGSTAFWIIRTRQFPIVSPLRWWPRFVKSKVL